MQSTNAADAETFLNYLKLVGLHLASSRLSLMIATSTPTDHRKRCAKWYNQ